MEARELRIGNIIKDPILLITVTAKLLLAMENNGNYKDLYVGMPLTEDILLRCGFKPADKTDSFGGFLSPELPNGNKIRIKNNTWNSQHLAVKIEFLHQLQNLYYALTGTELQINLQ